MKGRYMIVLVLVVMGALTVLAMTLLALLLVDSSFMEDMESLFKGSVAVIPIKGPIMLDGCSPGLMSAGRCTSVVNTKELFEKANSDPTIKAILLDIDSGGGAVVASRELMRVVNSSQKPVVSWIGEIGASGAYYAASASDYIVSDESSMTGSLGAIIDVVHYYGLMDKVGLNVTVIKSGESKDIGSPYREMTEEERAKLSALVNKTHQNFIRDVAANRGLPLDHVKNISKGDIYFGSEALTLGLVDQLGGFDDALAIAGEMGGIEGGPNKRLYATRESLRDLLGRLSYNVGLGFGESFL